MIKLPYLVDFQAQVARSNHITSIPKLQRACSPLLKYLETPLSKRCFTITIVPIRQASAIVRVIKLLKSLPSQYLYVVVMKFVGRKNQFFVKVSGEISTFTDHRMLKNIRSQRFIYLSVMTKLFQEKKICKMLYFTHDMLQLKTKLWDCNRWKLDLGAKDRDSAR